MGERTGWRDIAPVRRAGLGLLTAGCLVSCENPPPQNQESNPPTLPDPGAVDVVLDSGRSYPDAPLLPLREDLRIGAASGPSEVQFHQIIQIAIDADDRIYVAENGSGQVRAFAQDGAFLWSFGKQGQGPGEFQFITDVFLQGDTVVVVDAAVDRLTRLTPRGTLIESVSFASPEMRFSPAAATPRGFFVKALRSARSTNRPQGSLLTDSLRVYWIPADRLRDAGSPGESVERIGVPVLTHVFGHRYIVSAGFSIPPLWDIAGETAFGGSGMAYVHGGAEYVIEVYDEVGRLRRRLTGSHMTIPITPALVDDVRTWLEESVEFSTENARTLRGRALRMTDLPTGPSVPVLGRMLVSRAGTIWIERLDLTVNPAHSALRLSSRGAARWDVITPTGALLGTVELPPAFLALAVSDRSIVGVWRDSLGVEYVRRFVLEFPG
jgi:hypothetical protein